MHTIRGVSGSDKSNETDDPNQFKPKKKPMFMVRIKNRTEPIENRSGLVRFSVPVFRSNEQTEPNQHIVYMLNYFFR